MQKIYGTRLITHAPEAEQRFVQFSLASCKLAGFQRNLLQEIKTAYAKPATPRLDGYLSTNLHNPSCRYLKEIRGVTRRPGEGNKQVILPGGHTGFC